MAELLKNKIDFVAFAIVRNANPNGDPLNGNRPRVNYDGYGEISDVCLKRKIRNRMQDLGNPIFVQSADRVDDGYESLSERAAGELKGIKDREKYAAEACKKWLDVRSFGQVFAFKSTDKNGVSVGVRGPVSIQMASSLSPVEVESQQITKSVNGEPAKGGRSSDTMGMKGSYQCAARGKNRFYRGGCRSGEGVSLDAVSERCFLRATRWIDGNFASVLVETQLQRRSILFCESARHGTRQPARWRDSAARV